MTSVREICERVDELRAGEMELWDFEDWFRDSTYNAHAWGSQSLKDLVNAVEAVLSEVHFEGMGAADAINGLAGCLDMGGDAGRGDV